MKLRNQSSLARLILAGVVLVVASGCGSGRQAQCRALGTATQEVMNNVQATHQGQIGKNAYDPEYELQQAETWEEGVEIVQAVELSDSTLQDLRDDLAAAYQQAADTKRQVAEITPANGRPSAQVEAQISDINSQAGEAIPTTINKLNQYCL